MRDKRKINGFSYAQYLSALGYIHKHALFADISQEEIKWHNTESDVTITGSDVI